MLPPFQIKKKGQSSSCPRDGLQAPFDYIEGGSQDAVLTPVNGRKYPSGLFAHRREVELYKRDLS
jgi:hypothetical protein